MSTKVTTTEPKKPATIRQNLESDSFKMEIAKALPKHLTPERFIRVAVTAMSRVPKLAECDQKSFFKALVDLSSLGLEPDGRHAHLIPFENRKAGIVECQLIIDYKGKVDLVRRDPNVIDVQCYTVRENDDFQWKNGQIEHSFGLSNPRGEVIATYTQIQWKNGHTSTGEPFLKEDAEKSKSCSKAGNFGPWKTNYVEMWRKSNIHRDSKLWPLSPEIRESLDIEEKYMDFSQRADAAKMADSFVMPEDPFPNALDSKTEEVATDVTTEEKKEGELI